MTTATPIDEQRSEEPDPPARRRRPAWHWVRFAVVIVVVMAAGVFVARIGTTLFAPHLYSGTVLQSPTPSPEMDGLVLGNGEPMDMAMFEGDVVLMYFGYTNCPDVCPTTLAAVANIRGELSEADRERVHVLMVSVDPDRDPLDSLQTYVEFFDEDFLAVGGEMESIDRAAAQYGVFYAFGETEADGSYTVDHTASLLGIGPDGHLRVVWGPEVERDALAADVSELLGT